jgi:hypothetical protein
VAAGPAGGLIAWMTGDDLLARDWPPGEPLRPPSQTSLPGAYLSALGVAADGGATALITSDDPHSLTLAAARRPPAGTFGPLQHFAAGGPNAALLVEPGGGAHALWARYTRYTCDERGRNCNPAAPLVDASDASAGGAFGAARTIGPRDNGDNPAIAGAGGGALAGWVGDHGPWVSALGPRIGASRLPHALRGPRVVRFARHGRRTFTFRLSRPAHVLIDVSLAEPPPDGEAIRRVGEVTLRAGRGLGRATLPKRVGLVRGRFYTASLIAQDATGHDSKSIAPVVFRGG